MVCVTIPPMPRTPRDRYVVKSLVHASEILGAFESAGDVLRLRDVVECTGLSKGMCFRLLYTLHQCGFLEKVDELHYRMTAEVRRRKRFRIGYAAQGQNSSFAREVHASLLAAAPRAGLELIVVDNRYQPKVALRNADHLVKENVDLVIEFQTDESVAPAIASRYLEAGIPLIAIDIPHPGATYFGANNYQAGVLGGRYLGRWARNRWHGEIDEILLVELARAGSLVRARSSGLLEGITETLRHAAGRPCQPRRRRGDGRTGHRPLAGGAAAAHGGARAAGIEPRLSLVLTPQHSQAGGVKKLLFPVLSKADLAVAQVAPTSIVLKADDGLRITVQLLNVADGNELWSEKYDRTMNDVFALQEEIAGAIRFLLSDEAAFITGQVLDVDGGFRRKKV
jgi:hypothetical protein